MRMGFLSALVIVLAAAASAGSAQATDEAAIRRVVERFDDTRNTGDWKGFTALFTKEADQLISSGTWRRGPDDIAKGMQEITSTAYKGATHKTTADRVRMLGPGVAISDGAFTITNIAGGGGRKGLVTMVLVKDGSEWRIAAARSMVPTPAGALPAK
jgi:uncharacterized protein (TIGR02246 family)